MNHCKALQVIDAVGNVLAQYSHQALRQELMEVRTEIETDFLALDYPNDTQRLGLCVAMFVNPDGKEGTALGLASDMLNLSAQPEDPAKSRSELLACVDLALKLLETK